MSLDISYRDYRKNTLLHLSAGLGELRRVEELLRAGADASARNTFKCTPLHEITSGGALANAATRVRIVELLLEAGSPLEALDSSARTPLWYAAATGTAESPPALMKARLAVVKLLLVRGADPARAAAGELGSPLEAARGLHQSKKYRLVWPEAVALLQAGGTVPRST